MMNTSHESPIYIGVKIGHIQSLLVLVKLGKVCSWPGPFLTLLCINLSLIFCSFQNVRKADFMR